MPNPTQLLAVGPRVDVVQVPQRAGGEDQRDVNDDEEEKPDSTRKCSERAAWMLSRLLMRVNRVESAGDMPSPVTSASGAAKKTVMK